MFWTSSPPLTTKIILPLNNGLIVSNSPDPFLRTHMKCFMTLPFPPRWWWKYFRIFLDEHKSEQTDCRRTVELKQWMIKWYEQYYSFQNTSEYCSPINIEAAFKLIFVKHELKSHTRLWNRYLSVSLGVNLIPKVFIGLVMFVSATFAQILLTIMIKQPTVAWHSWATD